MGITIKMMSFNTEERNDPFLLDCPSLNFLSSLSFSFFSLLPSSLIFSSPFSRVFVTQTFSCFFFPFFFSSSSSSHFPNIVTPSSVFPVSIFSVLTFPLPFFLSFSPKNSFSSFSCSGTFCTLLHSNVHRVRMCDVSSSRTDVLDVEPEHFLSPSLTL